MTGAEADAAQLPGDESDPPPMPPGPRATDAPAIGGARALQITDAGEGRLVVAGDLDAATATFLDAAVRQIDFPGPLHLDLRLVGILQSAGVGVLFDHASRGLQLQVRAGSAVEKVLNICGLAKVAEIEATDSGHPPHAAPQ